MTNTKQHGGARKGAGRKKLSDQLKKQSITIRLNEKEKQAFLFLGGSKWLRDFLKSTM